MTSESGCATKVGSDCLRCCRRPLQGTTTLSLGWTICEPRPGSSNESVHLNDSSVRTAASHRRTSGRLRPIDTPTASNGFSAAFSQPGGRSSRRVADLAAATNQAIRRAVVPERRLVLALELGDDALG